MEKVSMSKIEYQLAESLKCGELVVFSGGAVWTVLRSCCEPGTYKVLYVSAGKVKLQEVQYYAELVKSEIFLKSRVVIKRRNSDA